MVYLYLLVTTVLLAMPSNAVEPDFNIGGLKWRCENQCDSIKRDRFVKVEQRGTEVVFTDGKGNTTAGKAETDVHTPKPSSGPSLRCQMNPAYCGKEPKPKTQYYRTIKIPDWNCSVSVQQVDGNPYTPPPFKAQWLRFASPKCEMGTSIWTTLSEKQVKALRRKCGEWGENC